MRISIVGTGYVGLVSGVCLAEIGHDVICIDIDQSKVDQINQGITPIYEKDLEPLLHKHIGKKLKAVTDLHSAVLETDVTFIAVGTPFDGQYIDLSFIKTVSEQIGEALKSKSTYHVVVVKSTVVPGTSDEVVSTILEKISGKTAGLDFGVGMNPDDVQNLGWVDEALARMKKKRRIRVFTRHYQAAMLLAEEKDLIVTIPARAARMQKDNPRLVIKQPPFRIPTIDLKMAWSPLLHHNPAHQWMRRLIVSVGRKRS